MKASVYNRKIVYDFEQKEVDFLRLLEVWDTLKERLMEHEKITIEGYERIEIEEDDE
jgi:hypothetical protein